jgi:hypothetical protein
MAPIWAPDGESVSFASNRVGISSIYTKVADGTADER